MKRSILIGVLVLAALLPAQEGRGKARLTGEIVDESGNPIAGAEITIESLEFNFSLTTKSDKRGRWNFLGLGTGPFRIRAVKDGYLETGVELMVSQLKPNPKQTVVLKSISEVGEPVFEHEESRQMFIEGNRLFEEGKYGSSLALFQEFLEKNPTLYIVRLNIGHCLREMKDYEGALREYAIVLERLQAEHPDLKGNKNAAAAYASIGEVHMAQDNLEKAREYFSKSIDVDPGDHALAYNVGEILFNSGKVDEAIVYYDIARKAKPDWPEAYLKLGYAYLNKGETGTAIPYFEKYVELDEDDPYAESIKDLIRELKKLK